MTKCICGLDHSKPVPDIFDAPPIVYSSSSKLAVCHACNHTGPRNADFFGKAELHDPGCKYIKSLKKEVEDNGLQE